MVIFPTSFPPNVCVYVLWGVIRERAVIITTLGSGLGFCSVLVAEQGCRSIETDDWCKTNNGFRSFFGVGVGVPI